MNIKPFVVPAVVAVLVVGAVVFLTRKPVEKFGDGDLGQVQTLAIGDITQDQVGERVAISGTITKECPHSGCWALIKDDSGEIRIDTKAGGFALPLHREGSRVRIAGTIMLTEGGDVEISAETAEL